MVRTKEEMASQHQLPKFLASGLYLKWEDNRTEESPCKHIHTSMSACPGGIVSGKASSEKFSHMEGVLSVCRVIGFSN